MIDLRHGDCLEIMKSIPDKSIDLVLTDPPYGTTACKWDHVIPFDLMWSEIKRIRKDRSAICLFGSEPFSSHLRMSNIDEFKYDWIWTKTKVMGFMVAKLKPLSTHEIISVFSNGKTANCNKNNMIYYPQGLKPFNKKVQGNKSCNSDNSQHKFGRKSQEKFMIREFTNYPRQIISFNSASKTVHPTQKPVPLLEYLIKTYTQENKTVLDFTMGSGSTGVACKNLNRAFIGIEKDEKYFNIAKERINNC
jgi:site-specific DNA-methyltransferase (adenine-specific)